MARFETAHCRKALPVLMACLMLACLLPLSLLAAARNAHADEQRTLTDIFGITRAQVVGWLAAHESDAYYLTTPYRPYDWRSPNGDINGWGTASDGVSAGMNCTGFVWHALCAAYGWGDSIATKVPALQGWVEAIRSQNLAVYSYDSKEAMLSDGRLEKGDIIWMFDKDAGGMDGISDFHHVGFFWGDSPSDDKLWHSIADEAVTWSGSNRITEIQAKAASVLYVVVKTEPEVRQGYIDLVKVSALPSITDGNACYSTADAQYDILDADRSWIQTLTTNADGWATSGLLDIGWYIVKEKTASQGYLLDTAEYWVEVKDGQTTRVNGESGGTVRENPLHGSAKLWVSKVDDDTAESRAQGCAALAGAEFQVEYYDGYYSTTDTRWTEDISPTRTWVVKTDEEGRSEMADSSKVAGDPFYYDSAGAVIIPLGTITVQETKAPPGYLVNDSTVSVQHIKHDGLESGSVAYLAPIVKEQVIRGGVKIQKLDKETQLNSPLGNATVDGALFNITSKNPNPVVVEGTRYTEGQVVKTIVTEKGIANTAPDTLPFGTYEIREVAAPGGYLLTNEPRVFSISEEGAVVELSGNSAIADQVIRGDLEFVKVEAETMGRLASIPFEIRSKTTGEAHIVVTDENGFCSTSAEWNLHSNNTNRGESSLDGVWFGLAEDGTVAPVDDSLGALPFDTYQVTELPCAANKGKVLVSFEVVIKRNATTIDIGTITNEFGHTIELSKFAIAGQEEVPGAHFTLTRLDDNKLIASWVSGAEPYVVENVEAGTYELSESRAPDGYALSANSVVFRVYDTQPVTQVAMENNVIPEIQTSAVDAVSGTRKMSAIGTAKIVDTVHFSQLSPGTTYTITGILMDKASGKPLLVNGSEVTSAVEFVPTDSQGSVAVEFAFDTKGLAGTSVVAFETLYQGEVLLAAHTDIDNEEQTVDLLVPHLQTEALDKATGTHRLVASDTAAIVDTIAYENLSPGCEYVIYGTLMNKSTNEALVVDSQKVTATTSFTPSETHGTTQVEFEFDARSLSGASLVAYETLCADDVELASHADIDSAEQTVTVVATASPQTGDIAGAVIPALLVVTGITGAAIIKRYFLYRKSQRKKYRRLV